MDALLANDYYVWGGLAVLLLLAEAATFTSVALVFSIAASVVFLSLLLAGVPESMAGQVLLFTVSGVALYFPIRRFQQNTATLSTTGDVEASIAKAPGGKVKGIEADGCSGRVTLAHPFLGEREWMFESDKPVQVGDSITIVDVRGNTVIIYTK